MWRHRRLDGPRCKVLDVLLLLGFLLLAIPTVSAGAVSTAEEACGSMNFTLNQEMHYGKSEFIQHSHLAKTVSELLAIFYTEEDQSWSITPADLKELVLSNIHKVAGEEGATAKIYGSAVAFEPNIWGQTIGLEAGVPFPATSDACMSNPHEFCPSQGGNIHDNNTWTEPNHRLDTLALNPQGETIYCPYAYHGSPSEITFANCSKSTPEYCPTMDIAHSYDYSAANDPSLEWYTAPRCLFFKEGIRSGYWTAPYFDEGAGNINMVTFSQPITKGNTFLGIATIDIEVSALCYGNQCDDACPVESYNYSVSDCFGPSGDRVITYTTDDPSCPIDPDALSTLSCNYVPTNSTVGILCFALASLGAAVCLGVLLLLFLYRHSALIRASQVNISYGFAVSAMLTNLSALVHVGDYHGKKCSVFLWAALVPVTMFLAFLFGKVFRTYRVFMEAKQCQRYQLSDSQLLLRILLVIMIQLIILLVWTLVENPHSATRAMTESVDSRYCEGDDCFPTEEYCAVDHNGVVGIVSLGYLVLLVLVGCVLSFQSRKLPNCFSEAKYVMFAMYNFAVNATILLVVVLTGGQDLPVTVRSLLFTFLTFVSVTGSVLIIYTPKLVRIWSTPEREMSQLVKVQITRAFSRTGSAASGSDVAADEASIGSGNAGNASWVTERRSYETPEPTPSTETSEDAPTGEVLPTTSSPSQPEAGLAWC